jgi:hypothetical protein
VPGPFIPLPESVGGPRGRLNEHQDAAAVVLGRQLLDERRDRRRDPVPSARQHRVLHLSNPAGAQPRTHESGESVRVPVFLGSADDIAAPQVLQIVGEGGQRGDHIVDVRDVLLPFRPLVLSLRELGQIDPRGHDGTTFLLSVKARPAATEPVQQSRGETVKEASSPARSPGDAGQDRIPSWATISAVGLS